MATLERENSKNHQVPPEIYSRFKVLRFSSETGTRQIQKCEALDLGNDEETILYYGDLPERLTSEQQGNITDLRASGLEIFDDGQRLYIRDSAISDATLERLTACGLLRTPPSAPVPVRVSDPSKPRNGWLIAVAAVFLLGSGLFWFKQFNNLKPIDVPRPEPPVQLPPKQTVVGPKASTDPPSPGPNPGPGDVMKSKLKPIPKPAPGTPPKPVKPRVVEAAPTPLPVPVPPTATFTADSETVLFGQSTKLNWRAKNAASVSIDPGYPDLTVEGGEIMVNPSDTTAYKLTVTGVGGPMSKSLLVVVVPNITLFDAQPFLAKGCDVIMLRWRVLGASSVSIDHGIGRVDTPSLIVRPSETTTYTITAERNGHFSSKSHSVPGFPSTNPACQATMR